ncbi:MAG TPA: hypothetical protein VG455_13055 [Acidimicrobiales bacterium]|nr:hypothetical protein [Acidimicrobiales bacterium]
MGVGISILSVAIGGALSFAVTPRSPASTSTPSVGPHERRSHGPIWSLLAAGSIRPVARREERVFEGP